MEGRNSMKDRRAVRGFLFLVRVPEPEQEEFFNSVTRTESRQNYFGSGSVRVVSSHFDLNCSLGTVNKSSV
jgi:hypothetical protein